VSLDFFTVPTAGLRVLFVLVDPRIGWRRLASCRPSKLMVGVVATISGVPGIGVAPRGRLPAVRSRS
jgi:hypothetical protein